VCQVLDGLLVLFSSRRRHTKSKRDWSSDVRSSDLQNLFAQRGHTGREVDGGGGLAHTALLICHCYDLTHGILPLCGVFHVEHSLFHYRSEERRVGKGRGLREALW